MIYRRHFCISSIHLEIDYNKSRHRDKKVSRHTVVSSTIDMQYFCILSSITDIIYSVNSTKNEYDFYQSKHTNFL